MTAISEFFRATRQYGEFNTLPRVTTRENKNLFIVKLKGLTFNIARENEDIYNKKRAQIRESTREAMRERERQGGLGLGDRRHNALESIKSDCSESPATCQKEKVK